MIWSLDLCYNRCENREEAKAVREFEVSTGEGTKVLGSAWRGVYGDAVVLSATVAEFGIAEEVVGLIHYEDESHEVGIGEALRPYRRLYLGLSEAEAFEVWWKAVKELASL